MLLDLVIRVSWLCIIFFDTGACLPVFVKGQLGSIKRVGPLGWLPGTERVRTGRVLTGVHGGGSSGSARDGSGDWTSGTRGVGTRVSSAGSTSRYGHDASAGVGAGSLTSGIRRVRTGSLTSGVGQVGAGSSSTSGVDLSSSVTAGAGLGSSVSDVALGSSGTAGSATSGIKAPFLVGFPWVNDPTGGVPSNLWNWMPSQALPEYNAWHTDQLPAGMVMAPPMLPSSYIIQNGNGYQRGREVFSYSKYSDDVLSPFPLSPMLSQNPKSVPVTGRGKGLMR